MYRMSPSGSTMSVAGASLPATLLRVTSATLLLMLLLCLPALAQGEPQFFRIGSGVVDSPSFAVAGLVAAGLSSPPGGRPCDRGGSCGVPGMIALAQAIGSAAEAIDLLEQRQLDAVLVPASDAHHAYAPPPPPVVAKPAAGKAGAKHDAKPDPAKADAKPATGQAPTGQTPTGKPRD